MQYLLADLSLSYTVMDRLDQDETLPRIDTEALMGILFETLLREPDHEHQIGKTLRWIFSIAHLSASASVSAEKRLELWQLLYVALTEMQSEMSFLEPHAVRCTAWRYVRRHDLDTALLKQVN
jgi:hypothetical protein